MTSLPGACRPGVIEGFCAKPVPCIHIVDVGALWLGDEGYTPLVRAGRARVVGFEPIAEECRVLNQKSNPPNIYLPYAIADGGTRRFHRCNFPMTSSLYEPDLECMGRYHNLPHFCQVEAAWDVQTVRLDDVKETIGADFLKLDVQGAELDVLRGATTMLESVVAAQIEVEFVPIYRGQPLFAEVDQFLRRHGFMFHRFANMEGRVLQTVHVSHDTEADRRQILWADAVYVRDISTWNQLSTDSLLKFAVIEHELYGSFDFAATLLQIHDQKTGSRLEKAYLGALGITPGD
jgi:FkbM family methyltransferase